MLAQAGLTVGMMVVPQGMAYASVAGLPVVYGLYTAFVPVMIHPWFTTSNEITVGPTAIVSVRVIALCRVDCRICLLFILGKWFLFSFLDFLLAFASSAQLLIPAALHGLAVSGSLEYAMLASVLTLMSGFVLMALFLLKVSARSRLCVHHDACANGSSS